MQTVASAPKKSKASLIGEAFLYMPIMGYYVYILYSKGLDKYYKGYTNNVEERLKRHNRGYETYTSKGIPWQLKLVLIKTTAREAIQLEKKLKNLNRQRLEAFILKYGSSQDD